MFSLRELSRFLGEPIHLFVAQRQTKVWRFNSTSEDLVIGGETYLGAQMERDDIRVTVEQAKDKLSIRCAFIRDPNATDLPVTQEFGSQWWPYIPSSPVMITCLSAHHDEDEVVFDFSGQIMQPKFTDTQLELICEPTDGRTKNRNQGAKWQRSCWKSVYSTGIRGCNLAPINYDATLTAASGLTLTAPEFASATFNLAGGSLMWTNGDGLTERRMIMTHSGSTITVLYGAPDLAVDLEVVARPNCPRTWAACEARGNLINYGGAIYKPSKDPLKESMSWS